MVLTNKDYKAHKEQYESYLDVCHKSAKRKKAHRSFSSPPKNPQPNHDTKYTKARYQEDSYQCTCSEQKKKV